MRFPLLKMAIYASKHPLSKDPIRLVKNTQLPESGVPGHRGILPSLVGNESELITKNVVDAMRTNQENAKKKFFFTLFNRVARKPHEMHSMRFFKQL